MKKRDDFETWEEFERYIDYMMGNPADDWGLPVLVKVHWCGKGDGHWDVEGACGSHWTADYVWWEEDDLDRLPEGRQEAIALGLVGDDDEAGDSA